MFALLTCFLLAGCGQGGQNNSDAGQDEDTLPAIIEAKLDVPEKAEAGQEVTLSVIVSQGEEMVDDAKEVKFEIWKDENKDASEVIEAKHTEKGNYTAAYTFSEEGLYNVQSHVTARDMHTMPTKKIQVGNIGDEHHEHEAGTHENHEHHGDVSLHLEKPDQIKANEQTSLAVHAQKENEPITKAKVRLEISQQGSNPDWVDMTEGAAGEYHSEYQFPASGEYSIKIHIENDDGLHEHTEVKVTAE